MKHLILLLPLSALLTFSAANTANLSPVSRTASASDLSGEYTLVEDVTPEQTCPRNITHTSWTRDSGVVKIVHNTIITDGSRCDSLPLSAGGKALTVYTSGDYDTELKPLPEASPLPQGLVEMLGGSGPNIAALAAHLNYGEEFLIGYEEKNRVCGGKTVLPDRTTLFFSRPFNGPLFVNNFDTRLDIGSRWMIIVPRYLSGSCLYQQKIPGVYQEDEELLSSEEPLYASPGPGFDTTDDTADVTIDDELANPISDGSGVSEPAESDIIEPEPSIEEDDSGSACFPGTATVQLEDGSVATMSHLSVGDRVLVGNGVFSSIFAFSHADGKVTSKFITITTDAGRELSVTPGHYVYSNNRAIAAAAVKVGDRMLLADGTETVVTAISVSSQTGLYNPQTLHGDIVVEGLVASTYTTAVAPKVAQAILAPIRAVFRATGLDALFGALESGAPALAGLMPKGSTVA